MNKPFPSDNFEPIDPMLAQLKLLGQLEPSEDSKSRLRELIAEELGVSASPLPNMLVVPWWSRRVAIPIPLALAACIFWLMPFAWLIPWNTTGNRVTAIEGKSTTTSPKDLAVLSTKENKNSGLENATSYSFQATYLCGVGQIQNTTIYSFEESLK